jgi:hypothetical protein
MVSIPIVFLLINPRTYDGILPLLYYTQDSVIKIDINNKSIQQAILAKHIKYQYIKYSKAN